MNPFEQKTMRVQDTLMDWQTIYPCPYDKRCSDPYTRTRVILMNGTEFEAVWFSHQFSRNCPDNSLRRRLALLRRSEQQQQKLISALKPPDETVLEHTIGYEQLAVDLTAALAKREGDENVRNALNFALLEDFDHLYRYANLLEMDEGVRAEQLVGRYTEIMPARPTVAHHRHPFDSIKNHINAENASLQTKLCTGIITAAEQQTMNYYMNTCALYPNDRGRRLYQEIGMIEEQHVSHYGSLLDPNATWLENLLLHQFTEAYLYWSCAQTETDPRIAGIWNMLLEQEIAHLHEAESLLKEYEGKDYSCVVGDGRFPAPLKLESNIEYVRCILSETVGKTAVQESYANVDALCPTADFFDYQKKINSDLCSVVSHTVITDHICRFSQDDRWEIAPNPIEALRNRRCDNTQVGRSPTPQWNKC